MDELDALRDGLADGVHIVLPREPLEYQAALLRTLGATWTVKPVRMGAQELTTTRDCLAPGCPRDATTRDGYCDDHQPSASNGNVGGRPPTWTKPLVVAAIELYARETGAFPTSSAWQPQQDPRFPSYTAVRRHFDSWRDAMAAAGCPTDVPSELIRVEPDGTVTVADEAAPDPPAAPPQESAADERQRHAYREPVAGYCMGTVDLGTGFEGKVRCSRRAKPGSDYCGTHAKQPAKDALPAVPDPQPEPETPAEPEEPRAEPAITARFARISDAYDHRRAPAVCPICGLIVPVTASGRYAHHYPGDPALSHTGDAEGFCRGSNTDADVLAPEEPPFAQIAAELADTFHAVEAAQERFYHAQHAFFRHSTFVQMKNSYGLDPEDWAKDEEAAPA